MERSDTAPPLDQDRPARTEVLHERAHAGHAGVPPRPHHHPQGAAGSERAPAAAPRAGDVERLRGATGIAQLGGRAAVSGLDRVVDVGGASAVGLPKPLAVDDLVGLAVELARAVAEMHRRGVMHRDIAPANIVVSGEGTLAGGLRGRDLGPRRVPTSRTTARSSGRWPIWRRSRPDGPVGRWMSAPTCTRWARRCTSSRPAPPFGSGDPLRLIHDHLVRAPVPPATGEPGGPRDGVRDRHAPPREGAGQPVPERGRAGARSRGVCAPPAGAADASFTIGRRDGPPRLLPPSRLVGATPRWRRCARPSRRRWRAAAGGC